MIFGKAFGSSSLVFWALLGSIGILFAAGCSSDEEKIAGFMQRGNEYEEAGQLKEAIIEYKNVLQIDPNLADAHRKLANAYLNSDELRQAYWELSETIRLDPEDVESRLAYAAISMAAQNFDLALEQAEAILQIDAENAPSLLIRAGALESMDRGDEAQVDLILAAELEPDDASYRIALALSYQRSGSLEEAEAELLEGIQRDDGPLVRNHLANLLMSQERFDEVESHLGEALLRAQEIEAAGEGSDALVGAYGNLASFYIAQDRSDEGTAILEEGMGKVAEGKRGLSDGLVRYYRSVGNDAEANRVLESSTGFDPGDPEPWLALSNVRGRAGDLAGALEAAAGAVKADPENHLAQLRRAELLIDIGLREGNEAQVLEAGTIVDAVIVKDPSNSEAAFVLGKSKIAQGDPDGAVEHLRDALAAKPDWAQAHFVLGSALLMTGDLHRARAELARAVELNAALLPAQKLLVRVHAELGEHEYSIQNGRRYLEREPGDDEVRIIVAQSMVRLAMFDDAMEMLEKIPEQGRSVEALFAVGRVSMAQGDVEKAQKFMELAAAEKTHDPNILNSLVAIYESQGELESGLNLLQEALEANPDSADLWHVSGLSQIRQKNLQEAQSAFEKAIELDPGRVESYNQLARLYASSGKLNRALEQYRRASEQEPDNATIRHFLGVLYEMTGDPKKASEQYEVALQKDSNLAEAKNNLAYMMAEEDRDLDRALKLAQEAKAGMPDSASAADTLGWVLYKRGVHSAAIGYLREAVTVAGGEDTAIGEIRLHLSKAYEATGDNDKALETLQEALGDVDKLRESGKLAKDGPPPPWAGRVQAEIDRLKTAG
jgi:tetratricopeptide (TPR) repeat protein